ncbi:MAG: FAD-dependent oxidoreductase [Oscillospiraceae bacterium]|jgi:flavin-dependent dehydrogenase|nr:FAD-dependent oxidoreductase [Oscillospiraceae bacterium]
MANILVAGAGHGGLVAAALLAKAGYSVVVAEQNPELNLGHDWTDIFSLDTFKEAGIPLPERNEYTLAEWMTFFSPSKKRGISAYIPPDQCEQNMDRRLILKHLIAFAKSNGVTILFQTKVLAPILTNNAVTGLILERADGSTYTLPCDLCIDASGMQSSLRAQLPEDWGIIKAFRRDQYFSAFRAFYNQTGKKYLGDPFHVYFFPLDRQAVAWIASEEEHVDLLCGSFVDTDHKYAEEVRQSLLHLHPEMGDTIQRGGQVGNIPVRRPISVMVGNGYVACGDSAAMTIPIVGAGIANAIRAGRFLAETILAVDGFKFDVASLWQYQVRYMTEIGAIHAPLDVIKNFLLNASSKDLNALFEAGVFNQQDMINARTGSELSYTLLQMGQKALKGIFHLPLLLKLNSTLIKSKKLKKHVLAIPKQYDKEAVARWAAIYDQF